LVDEYWPRTKIGRLALAARKAYIESGGKLLNFDEINAEVRSRRGGLSDE
jgi:nitrous oxide reductase accessory protein NosL